MPPEFLQDIFNDEVPADKASLMAIDDQDMAALGSFNVGVPLSIVSNVSNIEGIGNQDGS